MPKQTERTALSNREGQIPPGTADLRARSQAVQKLAAGLKGKLIKPGDADFDDSWKVWTGRVDRHPAVIAYCAIPEDVIACIDFAAAYDLPVSVRSGGHSLVGHGTNDGGIVIDLSPMKSINIDPANHTARIEPGLTWHEVSQSLHPYSLALTSGDTGTVGVGGLVPGGGIGWMVRKYGLTIDHLRSAEIISSCGELLHASENENSDLFWALRGGGGNFGVVTAFNFDLHPGGTVLGGAVFYKAAEAANILKAFARYAVAAPEELTAMAILTAAQPAPFIPKGMEGIPVVLIAVCYTGDILKGEQVVEPLRRLAEPVADIIGPMPYPAIFAASELGEVRGLRHHVRSFLSRALNEDMLNTIAETAGAIMTPETLIQVRILGGAMSRIDPAATAFAHRDKEAMILITNFGPDPADASARTEKFWQAMRPYSDGAYVSLLANDWEERLNEAYPPETYAKLAELKNRYDPANLFRLNYNIKPAL